MSIKLLIVCFDVNSEYDEERLTISPNKNDLEIESPNRIIKEFLSAHTFQDLKTEIKSPSETKYTFTVESAGKESLYYEIYTVTDLSFVHNVSMLADAYVVFINLGVEKTKEQLDKIIIYLKESCSIEVKTYLVGVFKDKILPNLQQNEIKSYLEKQNFRCDYRQMCCGSIEEKNNLKDKINNSEQGMMADNSIQSLLKDIFNDKTNFSKDDEEEYIQPDHKSCCIC